MRYGIMFLIKTNYIPVGIIRRRDDFTRARFTACGSTRNAGKVTGASLWLCSRVADGPRRIRGGEAACNWKSTYLTCTFLPRMRFNFNRNTKIKKYARSRIVLVFARSIRFLFRPKQIPIMFKENGHCTRTSSGRAVQRHSVPYFVFNLII